MVLIKQPRYILLPDLLSEFHEKLGKGGKEKLLGKYAAYKVIVIDEWLISDLTAEDVSFHSKCKVWGQCSDTVQQFKEPCVKRKFW